MTRNPGARPGSRRSGTVPAGRPRSRLGRRRPPAGAPRSGAAERRGSQSARSLAVPGSPLVELQIRGAPVPHWIRQLRARWGATVRLRLCRPTSGPRPRLLQLVEIQSAPSSVPEILDFLRDGSRAVSFSTLDPQRILVRVEGEAPPVCQAVFDHGAICLSCPLLPPGRGDEAPEGPWKVLAHRPEDARPLLDAVAGPGHRAASLVRLGRYRDSDDLTPRQEVAVATALALGYFDHPRRAQLQDVAHALGVSRSAALENIRRGTRKLASWHRSLARGPGAASGRADPEGPA